MKNIKNKDVEYFKQLYPAVSYNEYSALKTIEINYNYNIKPTNIPSEVTGIIFGSHFNKNIDNLPNTIIKIELNDNFRQLLNNLHETIQELIINSPYPYRIDNLPNSIKKMTFYYINKLHNLPNSIEELKIIKTITNKNNYEIENMTLENLPISVKLLIIQLKYRNFEINSIKINRKLLPKKINSLKLIDNIKHNIRLNSNSTNHDIYVTYCNA